MAPPTDPYRTLGLPRGASLEDVKRAYRRLAKENHPDAAGPAALPRFLAIQAAYEQLVDGRGRSAGGVSGAGAGAGAGAGSPPRASAADPDRANATHRAYAGRSRRTRTGASGSTRTRTGRPAPGPSGAGATGADEATGGAAGDRGAAADGAGGATGGSAGAAGAASGTGAGSDTAGGRRTRGKATLGSTSYDGAEAGPFEPDWGGASWYGTTSGTYWTINPKEYADPRKHGPEYQARARRAARAAAGGVAADAGATAAGVGASAGGAATGDAATGDAATGDAATTARMADAPTADDAATNDPTTGDAAHGAAGSGRVGPEPTFTRADDPIHTTSSWWGSTAGSAAADRRDAVGGDRAAPLPPSAGPGRPSGPATDDALPPDLGAAARQLGRALTDERSARGGWRVAQAAVGWLPIAFGVGWAIGELTGCSRSSASCDGADPWLAPIAVLLTLIPLLLVPRLASIAAAGGIAVAIVAVPAAAILSATNDESPSTERSVILGIVLAIAWLVGMAVAIARRARSDTGGPVS